MKTTSRLLIVLLAIGFGACVSSYQSKHSNLWGLYGYDEIQLDSNLFRVNYEGDNTQPAELVDRYALYRAAELTEEKGYDFFFVMEEQRNTNSTTSVNTGLPTTSIEHSIDPMTGKLIPVAVTTQEVTTSTTNAHSVTKTIRMVKGASPGQNAYNAHSLLKMMAPSIKK